SQEADPRTAERPLAGGALRQGSHGQPAELLRLPRTVPLLHERRGHLASRCQALIEPVAPGREIPYAGGACRTARSGLRGRLRRAPRDAERAAEDPAVPARRE